MAHIFISYARKDAEAANRLVSTLVKAGYEAWIDRQIPGGELWKRQIVEAIDKAVAFLILLSPNSVASDEVRKELDVADSRKKLIFPLVIAPMTVPLEMEYPLAGLQRIDFATDPRAGDRDLLSALRSLRALEEQNPGWMSVLDSKQGRETLNAILTDPSLSTSKKFKDYGVAYNALVDMGKEAWQKKMNEVDARIAAISTEREKLEKQRETLFQQMQSTSSPETRDVIWGIIEDVMERTSALIEERTALREEEMSLLMEGSRERDKIMERARQMQEETTKLIERIWPKDG